MNLLDLDFRAIAPEVILTSAALLILVLDLFPSVSRRGLPAWTALGAIAGALIATWIVAADPGTFGGMIRVDEVSRLLRTVVLGAAALSVLIAADYLRRTGLECGE